MNLPKGEFVLSGVSICASQNLDILGVKFDSWLTFKDHVRGIVSRISHWIIGILRLVTRVFVDTSVLLRCYYAFVLPILEYCSPAWGSAAECHLQFLEHQVYSVATLCPDQTFLSLCQRRHVAALCMVCKVNSNSNHCLFSELPSVSVTVRHTRVAAAAHTLEFAVSRCRTSQYAMCFLPGQNRVWNDLPYTVFDTRTLNGFNEATLYSSVNFGLLPWVCFSVFRGACARGVCESNL